MSVINKSKILICDDHSDSEAKWEERLEKIPQLTSTFSIDTMSSEDFLHAIEALELRRSTMRSGEDEDQGVKERLRDIDTAAILVVDYDLLDLAPKSYHSGEDVAYLARCYSNCGFVVALNQIDRGFIGFDLKMVGPTESFADLNIGDPALNNRGLWYPSWQEGEDFRPWSWPLLPDAWHKFKKRARSLVDDNALDKPILSYLGFTDKVLASMSRSMLEFITVAKEKPLETTFRDLVGSEVGGTNLGLRRKDVLSSNEAIARVAAARVSHWLERIVLPGQHILVDAPHLTSRFPSLLTGDTDDLSAWNATTSLGDLASVGIRHEILEDSRFPLGEWLSREAWFWPQVSQCEDIEEVKNPWSLSKAPFAFCEDTSCFALREDVREFVSDVTSFSSPFARRYVRNIEDVVYRPIIRFSM